MVATVMRDNTLMVTNTLPAADQVQKLDKKDRVMYIYAGKPSMRYQDKFGTEARILVWLKKHPNAKNYKTF